MTVTIRVLGQKDHRSGFDCGVAILNEWLLRQAGQAQKKRLASVWVAAFPNQPDKIVGYYSLAPWQIAFEDCPTALRKRLPRYPIHITLIARLAVDKNHQGQGLGGLLLVDAMKRAWSASQTVPAQAVLVHAKDDQTSTFYQTYGFKPFSESPYQLYLPMASVAAFFK